MSRPGSTGDVLDAPFKTFKKQILDIILYADAAIIGVIIINITLNPGTLYWLWVFVYGVILVAAFVHRLGFLFRGLVLLSIIYMTCLTEISRQAYWGQVDLFFVALVFMGAVVFDFWGGVITFVLSLATILFFSVYLQSHPEMLTLLPESFELSNTYWIGSTLSYSVTVGPILVVIIFLFRRVEKLVAEITAESDERRKSEQQFRAMLENSRDVMFQFNLKTNEYDYVSPSIERMTGMGPEKFLKGKYQLFQTLVHPDDAATVQNTLTQLLKDHPGTDPAAIVEYRTKHAELGYRWISTNQTIVRDDAGSPISMVGSSRDITEQKLTEAREDELEIQLRQTQRMESVGELAGGVAHDFNNLLQAILGYSEIALENASNEKKVKENLDDVIEAGDRAKILVRQLLAFSRQQVLELSNLNLNAVVEDLLKMLRRVIGENFTIDFRSSQGLGIVRADRGQIEQILINLCVNARDAMGEGGRVSIQIANTTMSSEFCEMNTWASPGRYVLLTVTDTGCGMDSETQTRIFEPFFTTKELGKGTGLGLSTVFGIVRQHDGMVNVYSEIDVGTTFNIYLPVVGASENEPEEVVEAPVPGGHETILLADDDDGVRGVAKAMLLNAGYTVIVAKDGIEAIGHFDEKKDEIDLALLDVVMPGSGGKAVAEHIAQFLPDFPILFSSGYSSDAIHTNFVLDEGMHLIQKPYKRDELLQKVRDVLEKN